MKTRVQSFIANKKVLWNEGMTVALAWFEDDTLIINKGTKIEHSLADNEKTISGILPLGALGLLIKQMEKERQQGNDRPNQ